MSKTVSMSDLIAMDNVIRPALENGGYKIQDGAPYLFNLCGCDQVVPAFKNCFGNNPAAPYIMPAVPHQENEVYKYGPSMRTPESPDLYMTFRMEPDEAIVVYGMMPPEAAYFGFETYIFSRKFDRTDIESLDWLTDAYGLQLQLAPSSESILYSKPPVYVEGSEPEYPTDEGRVLLFANIGPSTNNKVLESDDVLGEPCWDGPAILSVSADQLFESNLNDQLMGSPLEGRHAHNPLGANVKMGLDEASDDLWIVMRYAVPVDEDAGNNWRSNVENNLRVLRVSQTDPNYAPIPHKIQKFPEQHAHDENRFAADHQRVASEVWQRLGSDSSQEVAIPLSNLPLRGDIATTRAMNCLGASFDTDTYRFTSARYLTDKGFFAVIGTNHTKTGNAEYVSLGLYDSDKMTGIHSISQRKNDPTGPLTGSAKKFFELSGGIPDSIADIKLRKFYVHLLVREDTELPGKLMDSSVCTVVDNDEANSCDSPGPPPSFPTDQPARVIQRAYLNPEDPFGSLATKLLSPILLVKSETDAQKEHIGARKGQSEP